jgi:hypothetical protein
MEAVAFGQSQTPAAKRKKERTWQTASSFFSWCFGVFVASLFAGGV